MTSPLAEISNNIAAQIPHLADPHFLLHYVGTTGITYSFLSVATSINPWEAMVFAHLAYLIDLVAAPLFAYYLEPYREYSLVPLAGQVAHLCTSVVLSQVICYLFKSNITLTQIPWIGLTLIGSFFCAKKVISIVTHNLRTAL